MNQTKLTVERVMAIGPCSDWPRERVRAYLTPLPKNDEDVFNVLSRINPHDARWLVVRLMTTDNVVVWAEECAKRAKTYKSFVPEDPEVSEHYFNADVMARQTERRASGETYDEYEEDIAGSAADCACSAASAAAESAYLVSGRSRRCANHAKESEHHTALRHAISLIEPLGES
jgi:hypothetical protein